MKKSRTVMVLLLCLTSFISCKQSTASNNMLDNEILDSFSEESLSGEDSAPSLSTDRVSIGAFLDDIKAFQYGMAESNGVSVNHHINYSYEDIEYQEDALTKITAVISEIEYELLYDQTVDGPLYHDTIRKYKGNSVTQWFDVRTGACVYHFSPSKTVENEEDRCTLEKQLEIARAFLNNQVSDPENYRVTKQERTPTGVLYVYFTRMVGEISTCDQVIVKVDQSGSIPLYRLSNVGEMRNVQPIPNEIIEKVNQSLENGAQSIYRVLEGQGCNWSHEKRIDRLVRLDDGSLALECYVGVKITYPNGDVVGDGAWFIIPITEPTVQTE